MARSLIAFHERKHSVEDRQSFIVQQPSVQYMAQNPLRDLVLCSVVVGENPEYTIKKYETLNPLLHNVV